MRHNVYIFKSAACTATLLKCEDTDVSSQLVGIFCDRKTYCPVCGASLQLMAGETTLIEGGPHDAPVSG